MLRPAGVAFTPMTESSQGSLQSLQVLGGRDDVPDFLGVPVPGLWPDTWSVLSNFALHYHLFDNKHLSSTC